MTDTASDVDDALFARVREHYDEEQIAELTMLIAWENASSRFNRALRVPSAALWTPAWRDSPPARFSPRSRPAGGSGSRAPCTSALCLLIRHSDRGSGR